METTNNNNKKMSCIISQLCVFFFFIIYWSIASCVRSRCVKFSQFAVPFCFGGNKFCELSLPILPTIFGISLFVPLHIILSSFDVNDADRLLFTILVLLFNLLSLSFLLDGTSVIESLVFVPWLHVCVCVVVVVVVVVVVRFCTLCAKSSQCCLFSFTPFTSGCSLSDSVPKACQSTK